MEFVSKKNDKLPMSTSFPNQSIYKFEIKNQKSQTSLIFYAVTLYYHFNFSDGAIKIIILCGKIFQLIYSLRLLEGNKFRSENSQKNQLFMYEIQIEGFMNEKLQLQVKRFNRAMKTEEIKAAKSKSGKNISLKLSIQWDEESEFSIKRRKPVSKKMNKLKQKKLTSISKIYNSSLWNLQENIRYRKFLINNSSYEVMSKFERKSLKVNVKMSRAVKTRTAEQCRSHHQKMLKYHGNNDSIILFIEKLMKTDQCQDIETDDIEETSKSIDSVKNQIFEFKTVSFMREEDAFVPMKVIDEFSFNYQNYDQFWKSILSDRQNFGDGKSLMF